MKRSGLFTWETERDFELLGETQVAEIMIHAYWKEEEGECIDVHAIWKDREGVDSALVPEGIQGVSHVLGIVENERMIDYAITELIKSIENSFPEE